MKVFVIDRSPQLLVSFPAIDAEVVYFGDEIQALNAVGQQQPEFIVLDYAVREQQTPEYIGLLLAAARKAKLVVVGGNVGEEDVFRCLESGANGYQDKQQFPHYMAKMIRVVVAGEAWISRKMVARVLHALRQSTMQLAPA